VTIRDGPSPAGRIPRKIPQSDLKHPMRRSTGLAAAGLALLFAQSAGLSGQSYQPFRDVYRTIQQHKLHLGPVRLVPAFRLTDVGYDSNVYFADETSQPVGDFTATLSPELSAYWLASGSLILWGMENPEFLGYANEMALRSFSNSVAGGLRWLVLRRFCLSAEYHDLSHVRRYLSDLDHRIRDTSTGGTASLFFETPRGTAIGVSGGVEDYRYEDVASGTPDDIYGRSLDRRETSAGFEVYYRVFSRSYVLSSLVWRRYDFRFPETAWRNGASIEAWGGFRFPLVGLARGAVRFGWKSFQPDDPARKTFSGLVAATDVSFRLGRFAFRLGLDRDNSFSYIESAYYYIENRARAGVSFYLFRSLRLDLGADHGTMFYPEPQEILVDGVPVVVEDREDVQTNLSFGPVVRISGSVGLGLTCNAYVRASNAPGFDVRQYFIGAFVTYEF
jgi:hypothetical protein